jgi:hypothetical protein
VLLGTVLELSALMFEAPIGDTDLAGRCRSVVLSEDLSDVGL